ncbi:transcription factor NF-E2 45 kDa subunit-like isoform X1 [Heptranchias perlo]|uniref:transcription factor NF-E2 45 kDa subunit-like isoform X1 n=3 Tax=Heptranchias perlo TaxID=212740 RepID=UPI00355974A3
MDQWEHWAERLLVTPPHRWMCSTNCVPPFPRASTEVSVYHPSLLELASDAIYGLSMAPCPPQYDGTLQHQHYPPPLGGCVDPGHPTDVELTWQELMSLAELQGLDADADNSGDPTFYGSSPHLPLADPYRFPPAPPPAWQAPAPAYEGGLLLPGFEAGPPPAMAHDPCASLLLLQPKRPEDPESDSGLSLDSSPATGSPAAGEGYGCPEAWGSGPDQAGAAAAAAYPPGFQGRWCRGAPAPARAPCARGAGRDSSSRDERRALALRIPFTAETMVNLPVDDFNELVSRHRLSEPQLALARDIRRRGKNKVAAQNCRQRKLENVARLERELGGLRSERERLTAQREEFDRALRLMERRMAELCQRVFSGLRDPQGRPYSPDEFALEQTAEGGVFLIPRGPGGAADGGN